MARFAVPCGFGLGLREACADVAVGLLTDLEMASWSPREAAEYRAAMNAQMLRDLATDKVARRGLRRLVGIARASGFSEAAVAGVKLSASAAASPGTLPVGATATQQGGESAAPLHQRRQQAPKAPPKPLQRLPEGMRVRLCRRPGWFTSGTWKATLQRRFGIKKQAQKLQSLLRVAAGMARWLARVRARVATRPSIGASLGLPSSQRPPLTGSPRSTPPGKMRKVEVVDADEEMGQAPPSPTREPARDELALLEDASRQLAARRCYASACGSSSASGDSSSSGGMGRGRGRGRDAG